MIVVRGGEPDDLDRYLRVLAGPRPGSRLLEIRFALRGRQMGRVFLAAHSAAGAARFILRVGSRTDVYVGVALRDRRSGTREAIDRAHLAFVEIDSPSACQALDGFEHPPTMIVASGTPGRLHAYWTLSPSVDVDELERTNRRLALRLGGDPVSVDAPRILRPPGSLNHKHEPPAVVRLLQCDRARSYTFDQLVGELPDPPDVPSRARGNRETRRAGHPVDRALLAIPAADYARMLTGSQPNRAGKIVCPFHEDHDPSLQLYDDGSFYCFGCGRGGSIYDFAGALWGCETKRRAFLDLRARLAARFGLDRPGGVAITGATSPAGEGNAASAAEELR
jgi:hypothetical protein